MGTRSERRPRKLLVAATGLAAVSFSSGLACGGPGPIMGKRGCSDPLVCGSPTPRGTTGGTGGDGGHGTQYCGIPDGGTPIPCDELDAGPGDAG